MNDPLTPMKIFTSLAGVGLGAALLWFHPGSADAVILGWPRLLAFAAVPAAVLFVGERRLSRSLRAKEFSPYPPLFPVLLMLLTAGVVLAGAVNRHAPSASRPLRPRVLRVLDVVWRPVTSVGTPLPGAGARTDEGIVVVESWRSPGLDLQIPVESAEIDRARRAPGAALEVIESDGFLGVPFVRSARFVAP